MALFSFVFHGTAQGPTEHWTVVVAVTVAKCDLIR
jgi:hypothetical protein